MASVSQATSDFAVGEESVTRCPCRFTSRSRTGSSGRYLTNAPFFGSDGGSLLVVPYIEGDEPGGRAHDGRLAVGTEPDEPKVAWE